MFKKFNYKIAKIVTTKFQTMGMFYLFAIYGLLPLLKIFNPYMTQFLYWSNFIQLISLPLLAVGQMILNTSSEQRLQETHDTVMEELTVAKEEREDLQVLMEQVKTLLKEHVEE
jgi:hypothetical protein